MQKPRNSGRIAAGVATLAAAASLTAATAASAANFEGPVLSKNTDARTFRMNPENHSNVTIKVTDATKFQRIDGFGGLSHGLDVEAKVVRTDGKWVANKVEKHDRGGGHGGGDDR